MRLICLTILILTWNYNIITIQGFVCSWRTRKTSRSTNNLQKGSKEFYHYSKLELKKEKVRPQLPVELTEIPVGVVGVLRLFCVVAEVVCAWVTWRAGKVPLCCDRFSNWIGCWFWSLKKMLTMFTLNFLNRKLSTFIQIHFLNQIIEKKK